MIRLNFYNYSHFPFLDYGLDEVQREFTAEVRNALHRLEQRHLNGDFSARPVSILTGDMPAGFFILDFGRDKSELSENQNAVLLRSLSVNPKFQGKGIGSSAMDKIPEFVRKYFPGASEIVLAVNENNTRAIKLYERCGYHFDGKTRQGRSGMQFILAKSLKNL